MNKRTLIIIICAIVLVVAAVVTALVMGSKKYDDSFSSIDLYNKVANSFETSGGMIVLDDDIILEFMDEKPGYLLNYTVVRAQNAKNINEVGIFKVENGKAKELKSTIEKYVADTQNAYRTMDYFPEDVEKIDCATVKVYGNYIVYSFLNEADTEAFYKAIENQITK